LLPININIKNKSQRTKPLYHANKRHIGLRQNSKLKSTLSDKTIYERPGKYTLTFNKPFELRERL